MFNFTKTKLICTYGPSLEKFLGCNISEQEINFTNEIKEKIYSFENTDTDIVITEVGGTIGDIESISIIEAIRQVGLERDPEDVVYIHVTLLPYISGSNEIKSKPTQHSVKELQSLGIKPDILVCRTETDITDVVREKLALFCNVRKTSVIQNSTADNLYAVPLLLEQEGLAREVCKHLRLENVEPKNEKWEKMIENIRNIGDNKIKVAIVGKYVQLDDSYISVMESLRHAGFVNNVNVDIDLIDCEEVTEENAQLPLAGQFYMLRAMKTGILLGRPISIFHAEKTPHGVELQFLILVKGKGTQELCALEADNKIQLLGPLGNTFAKPEATDKVCIVGGGIGVAPVAGFSENLNPNTYDFYACFKSGSYGLENVKAKNLIITTDDGSVGTKGMVSAVLTAQKLKDESYSVVYACGPTPMLAYIKSICQEANVKCWISMEARMACGMGVCLGCTIPTTEGYKRCCKDGPIFDGTILEFLKPVATVKRPPLTEDLIYL